MQVTKIYLITACVLLPRKTLQVFDTLNCHMWVISLLSHAKKLKHLLDVFCKNIDIRIVFSSFKIKKFFSFKDPIPDALKSLVVYQFTGAGCNSR